jgi:hypothetical protein
MVSLSAEEWFETPGSAILKHRAMDDTPPRDYLMNLQGMFSGKTEGDLDSVPGYYGGTASYRFVQNARALNQHRVIRHNQVKSAESEAAVNLQSHLTPTATRVAAYKAAMSSNLKSPLKTAARGNAYKRAGEFGAATVPKKETPSYQYKTGKWTKVRNPATGEMDWVYDPNARVEVQVDAEFPRR